MTLPAPLAATFELWFGASEPVSSNDLGTRAPPRPQSSRWSRGQPLGHYALGPLPLERKRPAGRRGRRPPRYPGGTVFVAWSVSCAPRSAGFAPKRKLGEFAGEPRSERVDCRRTVVRVTRNTCPEPVHRGGIDRPQRMEDRDPTGTRAGGEWGQKATQIVRARDVRPVGYPGAERFSAQMRWCLGKVLSCAPVCSRGLAGGATRAVHSVTPSGHASG